MHSQRSDRCDAEHDRHRAARRGRALHLHRGGTSVVVDLDARPHPAIVHWGEELDRLDRPRRSPRSPSPPARSASRAGSTTRRGSTLSRRRRAAGSARPASRGTATAPAFSARFEVAGVQANDHRALLSLVDGEARLAAQVELRVGPSGLLPPAHDAAQHRRHPLHRAVAAARLPRAVGRDRAARHHGPPPARADAAAARLHLRHAPAREPARTARAPTRPSSSPPAGPASASSAVGSTASTSPGAATTASLAERVVDGRGLPRRRRAARRRAR